MTIHVERFLPDIEKKLIVNINMKNNLFLFNPGTYMCKKANESVILISNPTSLYFNYFDDPL